MAITFGSFRKELAALIASGRTLDNRLRQQMTLLATSTPDTGDVPTDTIITTSREALTDMENLFKQFGVARAPDPVTVLPSLTTLKHWWDATDLSQQFSDTGGATPATIGGLVRRFNDKGTAGVDLSEAGAGVPTLRAADASINNRNSQFSPGDNGFNVAGVATAGSTAGFTIMGVMRMEAGATPSHTPLAYDSGAAFLEYNLAAPFNWRVDFPGFASPILSNKPTLLDEWVWVFGTVDGAGNFEVRTSGASAVTGSGTYTPNAGGGSVIMHCQANANAEFAIWDSVLTTAELDSLEAYLNTKYGVLPA